MMQDASFVMKDDAPRGNPKLATHGLFGEKASVRKDFKRPPNEEPTTKFSLDDFKVKQAIGSGNASTVFSAVHLATGTKVALKRYVAGDLSDQLRRCVENELSLHSSLHHPDILGCYGSFTDKFGNKYLVLDHAEGGDLFNHLWRSRRMHVCSEGEIVNRVIRPLATALQHLHSKNILHRDIKPENLLLMKGEGHETCKLSDFGFAKCIATETPTSRVGTLVYMAPEVMECDKETRASLRARGEAGYGPPADCWSVGVLAYECIFDCTPFTTDTFQGVYNDIHEGVIRWPSYRGASMEAMDFVLACMDVNPKTRLTAQEMLEHPWLLKHQSQVRRDLTDDVKNFTWDSYGDVDHEAAMMVEAHANANEFATEPEEVKFVDERRTESPKVVRGLQSLMTWLKK